MEDAVSDLYRLVYASKNLINAPEPAMLAEIEQVMAASTRNNARVDVTGALLFNRGGFAQVLEGPRKGVETTFERIQRDTRHGDVTVLQCGPAEERKFAGWSMAFVGQSAKGQALWSSLALRSGFDLARMDADEVFSMLHGLVLEEEVIHEIGPSYPDGRLAGPTFDATQLREELERVRPDRPDQTSRRAVMDVGTPAAVHRESDTPGRVADATKPANNRHGDETALSVLRAALTAERQRTTDLRDELDEARIEMAAAHAEMANLRDQRDRWAERARVLATLIGDEASDLTRASAWTEQVA